MVRLSNNELKTMSFNGIEKKTIYRRVRIRYDYMYLWDCFPFNWLRIIHNGVIGEEVIDDIDWEP